MSDLKTAPQAFRRYAWQRPAQGPITEISGSRRTRIWPQALLAATAVVCVFAASHALAQGGPPPGMGAPSTIDPKAKTRDQERQEAQLRGIGMITRDRKDPRFARAAAGQVKADFEKLQEVRNNLARAAKAGDDRDLKDLIGSANECEKRARRLRDNLAATGSVVNADELKDTSVVARPVMDVALMTLCKSIDSFVDNPMFTMEGSPKAEDVLKATRDLDKIIRISGGIRRGAEELRRTGASNSH